MPRFKIEASDGEVFTGYIPEDWAQVPLQAYATLAATAQDLPASVPAAHLFTHDAGCQALASLLGLPTAAPLLADKSLLQPICEAAPWLFVGPLPEASQFVESFTHQGVHYTHTGLLEDTRGEQLEALLDFLKAADGNALACAPHLLAVLYAPTGQGKQIAKSVANAAQAFATLPMSVAFPAVLNFLSRLAPMAMLFQKYSAARLAAEQALSALETATACPTSGPRGFYLSTQRWLTNRWIQLVRRQLATSSPPSATTDAPLSLPVSTLQIS